MQGQRQSKSQSLLTPQVVSVPEEEATMQREKEKQPEIEMRRKIFPLLLDQKKYTTPLISRNIAKYSSTSDQIQQPITPDIRQGMTHQRLPYVVVAAGPSSEIIVEQLEKLIVDIIAIHQMMPVSDETVSNFLIAVHPSCKDADSFILLIPYIVRVLESERFKEEHYVFIWKKGEQIVLDHKQYDKQHGWTEIGKGDSKIQKFFNEPISADTQFRLTTLDFRKTINLDNLGEIIEKKKFNKNSKSYLEFDTIMSQLLDIVTTMKSLAEKLIQIEEARDYMDVESINFYKEHIRSFSIRVRSLLPLQDQYSKMQADPECSFVKPLPLIDELFNKNDSEIIRRIFQFKQLSESKDVSQAKKYLNACVDIFRSSYSLKAFPNITAIVKFYDKKIENIKLLQSKVDILPFVLQMRLTTESERTEMRKYFTCQVYPYQSVQESSDVLKKVEEKLNTRAIITSSKAKPLDSLFAAGSDGYNSMVEASQSGLQKLQTLVGHLEKIMGSTSLTQFCYLQYLLAKIKFSQAGIDLDARSKRDTLKAGIECYRTLIHYLFFYKSQINPIKANFDFIFEKTQQLHAELGSFSSEDLVLVSYVALKDAVNAVAKEYDLSSSRSSTSAPATAKADDETVVQPSASIKLAGTK